MALRSIRIVASLLTLCCMLAMTAPIRADDVSAVIAGHVVDQNGTPVENATVYAYSPSSNYRYFWWSIESAKGFQDVDGRSNILVPASATRVTGHGGFFVFLGLLPGHYFILAQANGLRPGGCLPWGSIYPSQTWNVVVRMYPVSASTDCFARHYDYNISF